MAMHYFFVVKFLWTTFQHDPSTPLRFRIDNIVCLVIKDASGEGRLFLRDAVELRPDGTSETIQLRGPGELLLLSNNATFIRDSKVCLSTTRCYVSVCILSPVAASHRICYSNSANSIPHVKQFLSCGVREKRELELVSQYS